MSEPPRVVLAVSDHTGLTAEAFAHSLISRFDGVRALYLTRPFVDSVEKVERLRDEISGLGTDGPRPIVFCTFSDPELHGRLVRAEALVIGLFDESLDRVAAELGTAPSIIVGAHHGIGDAAVYELRLAAVDYSLGTDDGLGLEQYSRADIVLVGVSRVGKTPTCLYLSMHYGIRAANYPLNMADHPDPGLPAALRPHGDRLYGLTIEPRRLRAIRMQRRPDSAYASLERCKREVAHAEAIFRAEQIPFVDTTSRSIEEITATIIGNAGLPRRVS